MNTNCTLRLLLLCLVAGVLLTCRRDDNFEQGIPSEDAVIVAKQWYEAQQPETFAIKATVKNTTTAKVEMKPNWKYAYSLSNKNFKWIHDIAEYGLSGAGDCFSIYCEAWDSGYSGSCDGSYIPELLHDYFDN